MKAAIVLLANATVQNSLRRRLFELSVHRPVEFFAALLPAHVSLKQPFTFEDMDQLEGYFDGLAARTPPLDVELDRVYYEEWNESAILGLNVVETPRLRALHNQLNAELGSLLVDARANHDGAGYHFHMTIELGAAGAGNAFKTYFDALPDPRISLRFSATELGLFYYAGEMIRPGSFIHYRTQPLTGRG
jgi:2'-5' RNA ligase